VLAGARIAIVSGTGGGSRRYRCEHRAESLEQVGAAVEIVPFRKAEIEGVAARHELLILHRVPAGGKLDTIARAARSRAVPVLYDTDDLIFDPALAGRIPWMTKLPQPEREEKLERRRRALVASHGVLVSTEALARAAGALNPHVAVLSNVVSDGMVAAANAALARREPEAAAVTIGYFSGTASHDADFLQAATAVLDVLAALPQARLLVVGPLELDERFVGLSSRIERLERRPFDELPELIRLADVALAPLELGNRFAEAKSSIKYLEAGLVGVPVVASRTEEFARVIEDGRNGLLAADPAEWREKLFALVADAGLRRAVGERAHADVRARHTTSATAEAQATALAALAGPLPQRPRRGWPPLRAIVRRGTKRLR